MASSANSSPMLDLDSPAVSIVGSEAPLAKKKGFMGMFGLSKPEKVKAPKVKKVPIPFTSGVALPPSSIGYTPRVRAALGSATPVAKPALAPVIPTLAPPSVQSSSVASSPTLTSTAHDAIESEDVFTKVPLQALQLSSPVISEVSVSTSALKEKKRAPKVTSGPNKVRMHMYH